MMAKETVKENGALGQHTLLREAARNAKTDKNEKNEGLIVPVTSLISEMNTVGLRLDKDRLYRGEAPSAGAAIVSNTSAIGNVLKFIDEKDERSLSRFDNNKENLLGWLSPLNGQLLVDLGAGISADGYRFAKIVGARGYIGIEGETGLACMLMEKVKQDISSPVNEEERHIPASIISEDMLHALRRFPPRSVSVLASAIDDFLMWDDPTYLKKVGNETSRILHPKGTFVTFASDIIPIELTLERSRMIPALSKHSLFLK